MGGARGCGHDARERRVRSVARLRHHQHAHVLAGAVMPSSFDDEPDWKKLRTFAAPCPLCNYASLFQVTDTSAIFCTWPTCAAFNRELTTDEAAQLYERPALLDGWHEPVVYCMRMGNMVKIGTSTNIRSRFETIGPQGVAAVEPGGKAVERRRHNQFAASHSHREWFFLTEEIGQHIADLRESWQSSTGQSTEAWLADRGVRC